MASSPWICSLGDICTNTTGPNCNFTYTGYRVPLLVVSPYAKKHYVNHTASDHTAILKLIETRFGLAPLTKRDAAQTEYDRSSLTSIIPHGQRRRHHRRSTLGGSCYLNQLP